MLALAVRWILDQGGTVALWGARRPEQLAPVDEVTGWSLDAAAIREIDRIVEENVRDPVGPEFMAPPVRAEQIAQHPAPATLAAQNGHAIAGAPSKRRFRFKARA